MLFELKDIYDFESLWREGHFTLENEEIGSSYKKENNLENKFTFMN